MLVSPLPSGAPLKTGRIAPTPRARTLPPRKGPCSPSPSSAPLKTERYCEQLAVLGPRPAVSQAKREECVGSTSDAKAQSPTPHTPMLPSRKMSWCVLSLGARVCAGGYPRRAAPLRVLQRCAVLLARALWDAGLVWTKVLFMPKGNGVHTLARVCGCRPACMWAGPIGPPVDGREDALEPAVTVARE